MLLLVPAHPGSSGQRAVKRLLCCLETFSLNNLLDRTEETESNIAKARIYTNKL